jgi:hypothetical protein
MRKRRKIRRCSITVRKLQRAHVLMICRQLFRALSRDLVRLMFHDVYWLDTRHVRNKSIGYLITSIILVFSYNQQLMQCAMVWE